MGGPHEPMQQLPDITELLRLSKTRAEDGAKPLRVALLADTAPQILASAIRGMARACGVALELFEEFNQTELQVFDPGSDLYAFKPSTVMIYFAGERLADHFCGLKIEERRNLAETFMRNIRQLHGALATRGCETIVFNLTTPRDGVFGNFGNKVNSSLTYQVRMINCELMRYAEAAGDFHVYDLNGLQARQGEALTDPRLYCSAKIAIAPDCTAIVARDLIEMLTVRRGGGRKCLILDLDNTLWGGVIGDDGMERIQIGDLGLGYAFSRLQGWLKQLKERGIVLAVCSKNDDANAREPFLSHPDMKLRLDDIAVFMANWKDKATNIRAIRQVIDVGMDAIVFLDDNPVERQLIKESFPDMCVPDLPEDPCEYLPFIQNLNLFETSSWTATDVERTASYQSEARRLEASEKYVNEDDFLSSLEMRGTVKPFVRFDFPRVAQLTQRSNQFNLRTVRYSEKQIEELAASSQHRTFSVSLQDKFGSYGLISVVILDRQDDAYFIDTWLMSCRVLKRGVEALVLNSIVAAAREDGVKEIIGEYLPTAKNGMVARHYDTLGFTPIEAGRWKLATDDYKPRQCQIAVEREAEFQQTNA